MNYKIVITGGAGFIGSNLCEFFLNRGHRVVCLDNFSTGHIHNILPLTANPHFKLIVGDIRDPEKCSEAVRDADYVLHHAALGSVPRSVKNPALTNEVNISGFLNMLIAAKEAGVKRFIYAASSSTYGDSASLPKVEDVIGKPLSPYAVTKYVNELYADVFHRLYGIDCIGFRYFNVFGRKQDPEGAYAAVIPKFMNQLIRYESPVINGDGSFSRDFTYIDNVLQINELAIMASDVKALNTVYNVAYGERNSLNQLVGYMKEILAGHDPAIAGVEVIRGEERIGDIPHSLADISKAKQLLGYDPEYSFYDGLRETVKWYWENR